jgi:hypothetical protein
MIAAGMLVLILLCTFIWILVLRALISGGKTTAAGAGLGSGLEARGIVLSADRFALSSSTVGGQRFETRNLRLDIEVPGRDPYEISVAPLIPRICEVFPGSTLDLRVDPNNPNSVTVIGPAGSSGWMAAMPAQFPWAPGFSPMGRPRSGNTAALVVMLVILGIADAALLGSFFESFAGEEHTSGEGSQHSKVRSNACEAAARCCAKISGSNCSALEDLPEDSCPAVLAQQKRAAAKLHETCE